MKKLSFCILFLACILLCEPLLSQSDSLPRYGISAKVLFLDYYTLNTVDDFKPGNGLELTYLKPLNDRLLIGVPLKMGISNIQGDEKKSTIVSLDFTGHYNLSPAENKLRPYAFGGIGIATESFESENIQVPVGLGTYFKVGESSFLNLQLEYRKSFAENRDNLQLGIGWHFKLKPVPIPPADMRDTDKDGISDLQDLCPLDIGTANTQGCPDADGDGIADKYDDCPKEAGPAESKGCPAKTAAPAPPIVTPAPTPPPANEDSDGDGLVDSKDECPGQSGKISLMGCPDSDDDGIIDKNDRCPNDPGLAADAGCPVRDADKDGVPDDKDDCPDLKGSPALKGCPDGDGDGIANHLDQCPDVAGNSSSSGCPDADGDGINDLDDLCPGEAGNAATNGCPDSDGDSVPDNEDLCPEQTGLPTASGCPDDDKDSFPNHLDKCPDEKGTNQGCPDVEKIDKDFLEFAASNVHFEPGRATLKAMSFIVLDQVAGILQRYPKYDLSIEGHTDNTGTESENLLLSEERALSCLEYLLSRNIDTERMNFKGFGSSKPIADNNSPEGREKNRRVVFSLYLR